MDVIWTERAIASLVEVSQYIARDNEEAASRWTSRLFARGEAIATLPLAGRIVPELGRDDVREVFERTYRIVYQVRADAVVVLVVFDGRRLLRESDLDDLDE